VGRDLIWLSRIAVQFARLWCRVPAWVGVGAKIREQVCGRAGRARRGQVVSFSEGNRGAWRPKRCGSQADAAKPDGHRAAFKDFPRETRATSTRSLQRRDASVRKDDGPRRAPSRTPGESTTLARIAAQAVVPVDVKREQRRTERKEQGKESTDNLHRRTAGVKPFAKSAGLFGPD